MARTIDNLGVEISTRYAEDQEVYDQSIIKEAYSIPSQTKVTTTLPAYPSEFDTLFGLGKKRALWAQFKAPKGYHVSRRRLFAEQMVPILGTPDKQEALIERLEAMDRSEEEPEEENSSEEEPEEKKILLTLLKKVHNYDSILIDINSRRSQYQKG